MGNSNLSGNKLSLSSLASLESPNGEGSSALSAPPEGKDRFHTQSLADKMPAEDGLLVSQGSAVSMWIQRVEPRSLRFHLFSSWPSPEV